MQTNTRLSLTIAVCLIVGAVLGAGGMDFYKIHFPVAWPLNDEIRQADFSGGHFTSPLLECGELPQSVSDITLSKMHSAIQDLIDSHTKSSDITYTSVYFRDLNNGPWLGINESDQFFPASLLKVPLAMSFYARSMSEPGILEHKITYTPDPSTGVQTQPFGPEENVEKGKEYTIKQLIDIMLQESSNEAAVALAGLATPTQITEIYHDLGIQQPQMGKDYLIDTHKYASFFRILYNATYLDRPQSEEILATLAKTSFKEGLVAGVPSGTIVAHKFGSRQVDNSGKVQLHDCGIIYAKNKPYILCVMTQGTNFTKLASFIQEVSKTVYSGITLEK